jgi:hypothetical protein
VLIGFEKLIKRSFLALVLCGLLVPIAVSAYIEPGMAAILWQIVIAGLVGFMVFVRQIRLWFFSLIRLVRRGLTRNNTTDKTDEDGSQEELG